MDEREYRKWDIVVKTFTIIAVVLTSAWGIVQYRDTTKRDAQVRLELGERDYRKIFWEQQVRTYFELSRAAAALIENGSPSEVQRRRMTVFQLIIGPVQVFGSERVQASSNRVMECFKMHCPADDLSLRVMFLSADLRGALKESWNTTMYTMPGGVETVPPPDAPVKSSLKK